MNRLKVCAWNYYSLILAQSHTLGLQIAVQNDLKSILNNLQDFLEIQIANQNEYFITSFLLKKSFQLRNSFYNLRSLELAIKLLRVLEIIVILISLHINK